MTLNSHNEIHPSNRPASIILLTITLHLSVKYDNYQILLFFRISSKQWSPQMRTSSSTELQKRSIRWKAPRSLSSHKLIAKRRWKSSDVTTLCLVVVGCVDVDVEQYWFSRVSINLVKVHSLKFARITSFHLNLIWKSWIVCSINQQYCVWYNWYQYPRQILILH